MNSLLCDDLFYFIIEKLSTLDLFNLNIALKNIALKKYIKLIKIKYSIFNVLKKLKIINIFTGTFIPLSLISNFELLKFKRSFLNGTDYIDNIYQNEMSKPIMIGVDFYNRPFLCIKYYCESNFIDTINDGDYVLTIFQRFTGDKQQWVKAGNNMGTLINWSSTLLDDFSKKMIVRNIFELVNNQKVSYLNYNSLKKYEEIKIDCKLIHNIS